MHINTLNENDLAALCQKWKNLLRLAHWDIAVRICRGKDMPLQDYQGINDFSLTTEKSLISILDSSDYPCSPFSQDMEVSLVHELLHIPLRYFANPDEDTIEYVHLEAFIEGTAKLLVTLARKAEHNDTD